MMNSETSKSQIDKNFTPPPPAQQIAQPWDKSQSQAQWAPPPVWTRYIDSRLKQFCTR